MHIIPRVLQCESLGVDLSFNIVSVKLLEVTLIGLLNTLRPLQQWTFRFTVQRFKNDWMQLVFVFFNVLNFIPKTVFNQTCVCSCSVFKRTFSCELIFCRHVERNCVCVRVCVRCFRLS